MSRRRYLAEGVTILGISLDRCEVAARLEEGFTSIQFEGSSARTRGQYSRNFWTACLNVVEPLTGVDCERRQGFSEFRPEVCKFMGAIMSIGLAGAIAILLVTFADNAERAIMQSARAEVALWHAYQ